MRKFRGVAETTVLDIEQLHDRLDLRIYDGQIKLAAHAIESLRLRHRVRQGIRSTFQVRALVLIGICHRQQHSAESWTAALIVRGEVGTAIKRFAVRKQESGQWPASLAGKRAYCGLIPRVNLRPLVAIDFYGNKILVDDSG